MANELMQFKCVRAHDARVLDDELVIKWNAFGAKGIYETLSDQEKQQFQEILLADPTIKELVAYRTGLMQAAASGSIEREKTGKDFLVSNRALKEDTREIGDGVLVEFDQWLKDADDTVTPGEALAWLNKQAVKLQVTPATAKSLVLRVKVFITQEVLLSTMLAGFLAGRDLHTFPLGLRGRVTRLLVVFAFILRVTAPKVPFQTAKDVRRFLRHAHIVLPGNLFRPLRLSANLSWRAGFTDHYVVRTEWTSYRLGEIADVRNVFSGEFRQHIDERINETETSRDDTTEALREDETEVQKDERYELAKAIREEQTLNIHAEASVAATLQYPVAEVHINAGGGFDYGSQTAQETATRYAKDLISRAKSRVLDRKVSVRRQRELTRLRAHNLLRLDNTGAERNHVIGVYRWIDRIDRASLIRYPHRYLLEFVVPEPGAWLGSMLGSNRKQTPAPNPPPVWPQWLTSSASIEPDGGRPADYRVLAGYFKAEGIEPPPTNCTVSAALVREPVGTADTWIKADDAEADSAPNHFTAGERLVVPAGWEAYAWQATITSHRRYLPASAADEVHGRYILAVGVELQRGIVGSTGASPDTLNGTLPALTMGEIPVVLEDVHAFGIGATIVVFCRPTASAIKAWQQQVFDAFLAVQRRQHADYEAAFAAWKLQTAETAMQLSPDKARELITTELKRAILMLLGERPNLGGTALTLDAGLVPNGIDIATANGTGPRVLFLEQGFEWSAMAYQTYPFYWGPSGGWGKNALLDHPNPELGRFLSAGSARVVVPVRPGFETDMQLYLDFGFIWGGGTPPAPDNSEYLSVAQEIMDLQKGPDDGVEIDNWPVRVSTSLIAIDGDLRFPIERS